MEKFHIRKTFKQKVALTFLCIGYVFLISVSCNNSNKKDRPRAEFEDILNQAAQSTMNGNINEAERILSRSKMKMRQFEKSDNLIGQWHFQQAVVNYRNRLYEQAANEFAEALVVFRSNGTDPESIGSTYVRYTSLLFMLGDVRKTKRFIGKGLADLDGFCNAEGKYNKDDVLKFRVRLLLLEAEVLIYEDHLDEADALLQKILPILLSFPDEKYELARFCSLSGSLNFQRGRFLDAKIYLTKALELVKQNKLEQHIEVGNILFRLGRISYRLKKFDRAIKYFQNSIADWRSRSPQVNDLEYQTKIWLGHTYFKKHNNSKANFYYQSVIDALKAHSNLSQEQMELLKLATKAIKIELKDWRNSENSPDTHPKTP